MCTLRVGRHGDRVEEEKEEEEHAQKIEIFEETFTDDGLL